ncbi:T9SS type A sorting domain-containing protein [Flavobacterium sp.]|uniref:T9SS type A sorting domain-containing protein n=1 Tax=Flavobacterium sp. TaxID=239 RepID=UPI003751311D
MKTKKLLLAVIFGFFIQNIQAQKDVVVSGGNATGSGGTVSYSVGQVAYTNATGSGGTVTQGVQQPFEIVTLGTDNFPEIILLMTVYPNPTTSIVNLKVDNFNFENLQINLSDITGKLLQSQKISNQETQIQMESLPQAIYFLNVLDNNKTIKTFKIIKN